ncbi:MAG: hypothetical protein LBQ15_05155 [Clostridium sp.]|jgi:hypothetical protein|nr:hypothetical protein [Clostridium sp.]
MRKSDPAAVVYRAGFQFVRCAAVLFACFLFVTNFFFTCDSQNMESQVMLKRMDNPFFGILGLLLFAAACFVCCRWVLRRPSQRKRLLLALVMLWCLGSGLALVVFGRSAPTADSMSVFSIAQQLAEDGYGVIHPTDSYLSYYPQQVGLVLVYEAILRIWKLFPTDTPAYHLLKCVNVALVCVIVFCQYRLTELLFRDDRASCVYLVLGGANVPLLFYSSFVYGEIPSFAAFSAGVLFLYQGFQDEGSGRKAAALSIAAFTASVMMRKNALVLMIAVLLVLMFRWLHTRRHRLLLYSGICAFCVCAVLPVVEKSYELRSGSVLRSGVPPLSYLAMGMQEASRANGWYNGFNFEIYRDSGMDTAAASAASRRAISERLADFRENPVYAADFYAQKYLSQWADGTYACRQATLATFGGRSPFVAGLYEGQYSAYLVAYCNAYQNFFWLGAFLFSVLALRKGNGFRIQGVPLYLGYIGGMGGLLFHMLWEANSRYILSYFLLLLPYAAAGIAGVPRMIQPAWSRICSHTRRRGSPEFPG